MKHTATTHGMRKTPEYGAWHAMKNRCQNKKIDCYKDYGGRGIKVCQEWVSSFESFLSCVGKRPTPYHSLGRINNDDDYKPGNVRWETVQEQAKNRRGTRWLTAFGKTKTLGEWATQLGIGRTALARRLEIGWTVEKAVSTPKVGYGKETQNKDVVLIAQLLARGYGVF